MGISLLNSVMKICPEIRMENAARLADSVGGQQGFIEATGLSQPLASAYLSGKKDIGPSVARKIEAAFRKERGWLDHEHKDDHIDMPPELARMVKSLLSQDEAVQQFYLDMYWSAKAMVEKRAIIAVQEGALDEFYAGEVATPGVAPKKLKR